MHLSRVFSVSLGAIAATAGYVLDTQQPISHADETAILSAHLETAIWDILKDFRIPGGVGVVMVRKTAQGTWQLESKGYGNATIHGDHVTADTPFPIGSNSKLFDVLTTGLLISNETLTPRISWTSKIASIIPGWKLMGPVATRESNIIDLISHRTGIPRHDFMTALDISPADVIPRLQYARPSSGFRERTQYNNHMYTVLLYLPQKLLNVTYEKYVHDNILAPLGMNDTTYFYADVHKTGRLANAMSGAGGVISSPRDVAIWLQMLLTEGKSHSNETVIPAEVIRKAATGVTVATPVAEYPELSPVVFGGGQMRGTYRGYGFRSQITRFPSQNLGIAVMSNEGALGVAIMESVKYRIIDEVFQLKPVDWTTRHVTLSYRTETTNAIPPPCVPQAENVTAPDVPYAALAGIYTNGAYGTLNFCLFWENTVTGSACADLAEGVAAQLPGVVLPEVPTLIAWWNTMVPTHYMSLAHYDRNLFNLTALESYPTEVPGEYWVRKPQGMRAEFEVKGTRIGFAPLNLWGAGNGVGPPKGATVEERAEVWFIKT
ncbi:beta-lactamase/transpeptidase-like protein [Mycena galopus ATCC 62051]|nr:beta-lactamase/transpeptidase-like protein [Mycena galopus ATCC 62051]